MAPLQQEPDQRTQGHLQAHSATCFLRRAASSRSCSHLCARCVAWILCEWMPFGADPRREGRPARPLFPPPLVGGGQRQGAGRTHRWEGLPPTESGVHPLCQGSEHQGCQLATCHRGPLRQQPLGALALTRAHELTPRPESGVGPEPSPLPQTSKLVTLTMPPPPLQGLMAAANSAQKRAHRLTSSHVPQNTYLHMSGPGPVGRGARRQALQGPSGKSLFMHPYTRSCSRNFCDSLVPTTMCP